MKIIYTRVAFQPGYPDLIPNSPLLAMTVQHGCLIDGTPEPRSSTNWRPRRVTS